MLPPAKFMAAGLGMWHFAGDNLPSLSRVRGYARLEIKERLFGVVPLTDDDPTVTTPPKNLAQPYRSGNPEEYLMVRTRQNKDPKPQTEPRVYGGSGPKPPKPPGTVPGSSLNCPHPNPKAPEPKS